MSSCRLAGVPCGLVGEASELGLDAFPGPIWLALAPERFRGTTPTLEAAYTGDMRNLQSSCFVVVASER